MRGIFFDEDDARAVVARLVRSGFDASLVRERLAGEDDDEDHPWAVLTDAPELVLDLLVDEYDGWLDHDDAPAPDAAPHAAPDPVARPVPTPPPPVDLPTEPRRIKRP